MMRPMQRSSHPSPIPSSTCTSSPLVFRCSRKSKKNNKQQWRQQQQHRRQTLQNKTHYFPKSSPTPLIINRTPYTQTKRQALDAIVEDLEKSVSRGVKVDAQIFSSLLEACFHLDAIDHGIRIHSLLPPNLLRKNVGLSSKLIRLYSLCGLVEEAHELFDQMPRRDASAFPWNSLISGYAESGQYEDAMALYFQLVEDGVKPDQFTFPRVLKACARLGSIRIGEEVHRHIVRSGFAADGFVLNALVDMYAKCGDIVRARRVFDKIACPDSVSWNTMLTGYIRHELLMEALDIFRRMLRAGFEPDSIAISTILARLSSLKHGLEIHGWVFRRGLEQSLSIANSLIVMYCEKGMLDRARSLFDKMPERDVVSWNSIITGHREDRRALIYFEQMENAGVSLDSITFVSLLSACANLRLVEDGKRLFSKMRDVYGISASMEHYACMVNLLGRTGLIDEAYEIILKRMEFEAGPTVWGALLYACSLHGNVDIGEIAAERLFELEPDNAHNFQLLMKIYGDSGRLEEVERVRRMMLDRGLD